MDTSLPKTGASGLARAAAGVLAVSLVACAPSHNWRQVAHDGAPATLLMPCKPERATREVRLLGPDRPATTLSMLSCDVDDRTFAWAAMTLPDGESEGEVLAAWRQATWASLQQAVPPGDLAPPGWTQPPGDAEGGATERWVGPGLNHRREPLTAQVQWTRGGRWAYQTAIYGPTADPEVTDTFFDSLTIGTP